MIPRLPRINAIIPNNPVIIIYTRARHHPSVQGALIEYHMEANQDSHGVHRSNGRSICAARSACENEAKGGQRDGPSQLSQTAADNSQEYSLISVKV